jgi:hypothetical protein
MDPEERRILNHVFIHNVVGAASVYIVYEGGDTTYASVQSPNAALLKAILNSPYSTFNVKSRKIKGYTQTPPKSNAFKPA